MTALEQDAITGRAVLLFDGTCGLCNRLVRWLLRIDRGGKLRFAPLESALGAELLGRFAVSSDAAEGIALVTDALSGEERLSRRSDAVSAALCVVGGGWSLPGDLLHWIPKPLREWGYGVVVRHRYRLFGRHDACPLPTAAEQARILGI